MWLVAVALFGVAGARSERLLLQKAYGMILLSFQQQCVHAGRQLRNVQRVAVLRHPDALPKVVHHDAGSIACSTTNVQAILRGIGVHQ